MSPRASLPKGSGRARACGAGLVALAALLVACGGGHDASEKQLAELHSEIVKLRANQAVLAERLDGIELRGRAAAAPASAKPAGDRPELDVVRLSPDGGATDDPNADTPRPVIRSTGRAPGVIEEPGGGKKTVAPPDDGGSSSGTGKPGSKSPSGGGKAPAPASSAAKPPSTPPRSPTP